MKVTYNETEVDAATLLVALYRNTRALGMGILHDNPDFDEERARLFIADREDKGCGFSFDYVDGRPIKVHAPDGVLDERAVRIYDRDAGEGAFERAFEAAARQGGQR